METRNTDLRSVNSGTVYLPPNATLGKLAIPNLGALTTVQEYDLTTKYRFNSKTFVYCQGVVKGAGGEYANAKLIACKGAVSARTIAIGWSTTIVQTHPAGSPYVDVTLAGVAEDDYKYGHLIIGHHSDLVVQNRGIIANTATGAISSGKVRFYLDIPLWVGTTLNTTSIEGWKCPYGAVEWAGVDYEYTSVLGVPMVSTAQGALNGQFFWSQTWGLCWVAPGGGALGGEASERSAAFDGQGQLAVLDEEIATKSRQIAGYLIEKTKDTYSSVSAYDGQFIMLHLDP